MSEPLKFSVRSGVVALKITLDSKWQQRPFASAVVDPFVRAYNKKLEGTPVAKDSLARVVVDEVEVADFSRLAVEVVGAEASVVELFFGGKPAVATDGPLQFQVCHLQLELKITLDAKWQQRSFVDAVVEPFARAYNKKSPPRPVASDKLSCVLCDGVEVTDLTRAAAAVVPPGTQKVLLFFGQRPAASQLRGAVGPSLLSQSEQRDQFFAKVRSYSGLQHCSRSRWPAHNSAPPENPVAKPHSKCRTVLRWQVNSSPAKLQDKVTAELRWNRCKLQPSDGVPLAAALGPLTMKVFPKLFSIDLSDNDLRDEGVEALSRVISIEHMPKLKDLYLHSCRVGDKGVMALITSGCAELRTLMLHTNEIGDEGLQMLGDAIVRKSFYSKCIKLHSNQTNLSAEVEFMKRCAPKFMDLDLSAAWEIARKQLYT